MLELKNATAETIEEMIKYKYKLKEEDMKLYKEEIKKIKEVSPAKVQNLCFKYKKEEIKEVLAELQKV